MDHMLFVLVYLCLSLTSVQVKSELSKINEISKKLDELLVDVDYPKDSFQDDESKLEHWQKYEFGTGAGNREELRIKNISTKIDPRLKSNVDDYQLVEKDGEFFLAASNDQVFHFYKFDFEQARTTFRIDVNSPGIIRNFVLFVVPNSTEIESAADSSIILAILSVESQQGSDLIWYRFARNKLLFLDSWPVREYRVEKLQFFHHEGQNRLLILREEILSLGKVFTPIDIYGFDLHGERPNLWVVQRLNVPKSFDINVCPSHENTIIASRRENSVVTYEYKVNENGEGLFQQRQNVTSNYLQNYICFESGYIRYLVTSGPEAALFDFFESQFQHDSHSERIFNKIGEISWVQSMLVDNYRKESILFVQLKNASVVVLSWKGREFEQVSLPNLELDNVDFSRITVIPKYGFIDGNKLVKIETSLVEKTRPVRDEMEKVFRTKYALAEALHKQQIILDETEARRKKSYFENPRVTGFWNFSKIEVESLTIDNGVSYDEFAVGRRKMKLEDFLMDEKEVKEKFNDLESKMQEIKENLENSIPIETPEVIFIEELLINGSLDVRGTMFANTLTYDRLNGFSRDEIVGNFSNFQPNFKIEGEKIFESIDAENLNVFFVNGRPIEEFEFDPIHKHDYSEVDFSKLTKMRIQGNLNFSTFNGVDWDELMGKVILKSQSSMVPGTTTVEGDLVANKIEVERFNQLLYPNDYILVNNRDFVTVVGKKKLEKLTVGSLDVQGIETINDVSINEFVTTNGDIYLPEETTFENLKITENFQIDGNVSGLPDDYKAARLTLRDSLNVTANITVAKLTISGDIEVENSLSDTTWSELEDLVKINEEKVEITGQKIFLAQVQVANDLIIDKGIINGHSIDEFVTLDTDQEFPYLEKISGNVSFDHVQRDDLEDLKKIVSDDRKESNGGDCLRKVLVFKVAPIVDEIFFEAVNNDITALKFMAAINRTFANVTFQNIDVTNLRGGEFVPIRVNDENFEGFKSSRISKTESQELDGFHEVEKLEANLLHVRTIDGFSPNDLETFRIALDDFHRQISSGNISIEHLEVQGNVNATRINGNPLENFYDSRKIATAIFSTDLHVENLIVDGSIDGINFTNFVDDSVMKNDRNIVVAGNKSFNTLVCQSLQAKKLNGKSVDFLFDRNKHQILSASINVRGRAKVLEKFETDGKIGGIPWQEIRDKVKFVGNETYVTIGNISFTDDDVKVENLFVADKIQNVDISDFQKSLIYKNSQNITIYGPVIFKNRVTIDARFVVTETFNDLDVKNFYEKAVLIDRPLKVKSKILFTKNLHAEKDLLVTDELEAKTVGKIDLRKTYENAAFVDRPVSIPGSVSISNAIFDSNIEVEILNGIDLKSVITLEGEQTFPRALNCGNITVGKLDVLGVINGLGLNAIYENTLMLSGNQYISGHVIFDGNVLVRNNFEPIRLNGMDPSKIISLDGNDTLIGNFIFEQPLVLHDNLEVKGRINGIDLSEWQATGVTKNFPTKQIVQGAWTVNGNVHFDRNVYGNDYLDGTNVTKLVEDLHRREPRMNLVMETAKNDLRSLCEDLSVLKEAAENQVYKYEYFDYLETMNFDGKIISVHHVESEEFDYLFINLESCHLDIFVFTGMEFSKVTSLSNVGHMERWLTFRYEKEIFFLTVGKEACGKNEGNLWKFDRDRFTFIQDLGNVTDAKKIQEHEFLIIVNDRMIRRSIVEIYPNSSSNEPSFCTIGNPDSKFVVDSSDLLLVNRDTIEQYQLKENAIEKKGVSNFFGTENILSFRLGIYSRELFVYYDDKMSDNYLFISDHNFKEHKILQTIDVRRPSSIVVVDFEGGIENFLIFIEDQKILQIYEYRGIGGFVYRESIKMKADQIFPFKIRRYSKFSKKRCIAVIHDRKLVIMEAKMQGEKLDMGKLDCDY